MFWHWAHKSAGARECFLKMVETWAYLCVIGVWAEERKQLKIEKKQEPQVRNEQSTMKVDKQKVVHPYNKIQLSKQKAWPTATHNDVDVSQNHYPEWKRPDTQEEEAAWCHLHDILEKAN